MMDESVVVLPPLLCVPSPLLFRMMFLLRNHGFLSDLLLNYGGVKEPF
jgi:hypothetical protein